MKKTSAQRQKTSQKKSLHKQQRRSAVKSNRVPKKMNSSSIGWDSLHYMYKTNLGIVMTAGEVLPMLYDPSILAHVADRTTFDRVGTVFANDLLRFRRDLDAIYAEHSHRIGRSLHEDDTHEMSIIGLKYQQWQASYEMVILPNKIEFVEMLEAAAIKRATPPIEAQSFTGV